MNRQIPPLPPASGGLGGDERILVLEGQDGTEPALTAGPVLNAASGSSVDSSPSPAFSDMVGVWRDPVDGKSAERAWRRLSVPDRRAAVAGAAGFFDRERKRKREKHPNLSSYLRQHRWEVAEGTVPTTSADSSAPYARKRALRAGTPQARAWSSFWRAIGTHRFEVEQIESSRDITVEDEMPEWPPGYQDQHDPVKVRAGKIRARTVANGCTPAEAEVAARRLAEMSAVSQPRLNRMEGV